MTKREKIASLCEESILWDDLDEAIIGLTTDMRVVYDTYKIQSILMEESGMTYDEAVEYADYNIYSAHVGEYTPVHIYPINDIEL